MSEDLKPKPTYVDLIASVKALFETGNLASAEEATELRGAVDKLLDPGRGSTMDFSDPANSGLI